MGPESAQSKILNNEGLIEMPSLLINKLTFRAPGRSPCFSCKKLP